MPFSNMRWKFQFCLDGLYMKLLSLVIILHLALRRLLGAVCTVRALGHACIGQLLQTAESELSLVGKIAAWEPWKGQH
eukprot:SAG11_NODE_4940_length_1716_cov_2.717378_3_plen_78_part_00